jgi:hypothetical protein
VAAVVWGEGATSGERSGHTAQLTSGCDDSPTRSTLKGSPCRLRTVARHMVEAKWASFRYGTRRKRE